MFGAVFASPVHAAPNRLLEGPVSFGAIFSRGRHCEWLVGLRLPVGNAILL